MSPLLEVTEDTPPDMLTGSMDLRLVLPDGKRVRMSVDRRTPMMDLLVQVTTAYKITPAGNVLQPYGETGILPYKPSTPIGALDTWIVHIVPKSQAIQNPSNKINLKQIIPPFEQTLRFQVNLPRNQLYVTRVSGRCTMREILIQACNEKNLEASKYTLRHPKNLDKVLCEEMSIAEYGHNQVTMISIKNLPTAVSTEDILMMNKYKAESDSGSGSGVSSSVSPIPPVQPAKPVRKRRPAPKPPTQQPKQNETVISHSRTSSDSSGYHEASVLSESPDSNNSSLPDSLPRRSKLPSTEPTKVENKLSRSLSNLHQASTSTASTSGLKSAQSISCLVQARKKKPAPPPPAAIVEEKEDKSATLPASARLLESTPESTNTPLLNGTTHSIASHKTDQESESESARLEEEIERMFEQATREHVSLESGVELSRGPSPDWNWEYRLPAPPTFRDDVTAPSLADLNLTSSANSKQILFAPLDSTVEGMKEGSHSNLVISDSSNHSTKTNSNVNKKTKKIEHLDKNDHCAPVMNNISKSEMHTDNPAEYLDSTRMNGPSIVNDNTQSKVKCNVPEVKNIEENMTNVNNNTRITNTSKKTRKILPDTVDNGKRLQNISVKIQRNSQIIEEPIDKNIGIQGEKVFINIKRGEPPKNVNVGKVTVERSDTVIRVKGRQEKMAEQSAILNELTTVISERQAKPNDNKLVEPVERTHSHPLKNFSITIYSGSKPVEIYKEKPIVKEEIQDVEVRKDKNGITRSNSSAEKKRAFIPVKRSASVVTNLQRRLDLSRSNGNLLEVNELPLQKFRSNLRKTTSELSINFDPNEQRDSTQKETELQSLQVLRTILPQLSQSQGALNTLGQIKERKEEKPDVSLTTWGERPKRQVSIKTDRDYVMNGGKLEAPASVTVEVVCPTKPSSTHLTGEQAVKGERRQRNSVYRSIETGNTKAIRLPPSDLGRLPIVRAVELKKQPEVKSPQHSSINGLNEKPLMSDTTTSDKPYNVLKSSHPEKRQIRPPSYLFGCEPMAPPPPPALMGIRAIKLKSTSQQTEVKKHLSADPRDDLLESIRTFGKSSLRKVSTRQPLTQIF